MLYNDPTGYAGGWTHIAVIVDMVKDKSGDTVPMIVDWSGPTANLPRGMFDTENNHISDVAIIFIGSAIRHTFSVNP